MILSTKFEMKISSFFILFWIGFSVFSQEITNKKFDLSWNSSNKININTKNSFEIPYINALEIDFSRLLPLYYTSWEVANNSQIDHFEISNIATETINIEQYNDLKIEQIPDKLESNLIVLSEKNKYNAHLQLVPLFKEDNVVKKIISFELNYKLKNNPLQRNINASSSVLSTGKWYKIEVDTTGVFKIDRSFLSNLGISVNSINPKNIQIYGNGGALLPYRIGNFRYDDLQENAIYVNGEEDNSFDSGDYILFYAKGPESWKHSGSVNSLSHVKNIYSDKAYYFITIGSNNGKRIENATQIQGTPVTTYQNFDDYWFYEKDMVNLFYAGQQWFGESFSGVNQRTFSYNFTNAELSVPFTIKTRFAGTSGLNSNFNVKVNNQDLYTLNLPSSSGHILGTSTQGSALYTATNENLNIQISYNNNGYTAAKTYIDYIEIIGKRKLIANNKQFSFRNFNTLQTTGTVAYQIQNQSNIFQVWDVTDYINPKKIQNQSTGSNFEFNADGGQLKEYIVLNSQDYYTPKRPSDYNVENQNLHSLTNIDYLIITSKEYINEAETMAQYHRTQNSLDVRVIPLHQIYNEFGSGAPDITAIRDFVRNVYLNSNNRLKYLLLYGDASFDFKGISTDKGVVPAFQSYQSFDMATSFVTDDFYGIVSDNNEGDLDNTSVQSMDIAVARIPFNSANEAQQINSKILNYYHENSFGDWRNELLLIGDDADAPSDITLQTSQEALADNIKLNKPIFNIKKLWLDAYPQEVTSGGSRYPQVNTEIDNKIEKGALVVNYFGHGGEDGLALERIVETEQINSWNNLNNLNLFTVISCEFARFDNPTRENIAGERVIRNSKGGSAHLIATAREIYISTGEYFNHKMVPYILDYYNNDVSISENLRLTKNTSTSSQRFFIYSFGDPAMKLAIPKKDIKLTHMNGIPVTQSLDTIKALSHITFDGIVTQTNGQIDSSFNGELYLTVFDKEQDKQTLNNDGISNIMTFDTQDSKIFRGRARVNNGIFHIEFIAPQDIRIAYGSGKLSFYAHNSIIDKGGYDKEIVVGGINYNAASDNIGPRIKLYMNDTSFLDGGNTNQSPLLLAFFEDENGINTSFSSVDHDISATLDDDQINPYILNDYYITDLDDYTNGSLEYRLRDLSVGQHNIKVKAYDTYNNPGEASINFVVVDDAKLILEHVLNYPNPFVNYTEFWFNHNKPNEPLDVLIQIFTVSGKLVKTINQSVQNTGGLSREITWDGLDDFGQKIGKGVYVFKLQVKTQDNLKAEKFEKLVILQ